MSLDATNPSIQPLLLACQVSRLGTFRLEGANCIGQLSFRNGGKELSDVVNLEVWRLELGGFFVSVTNHS